MSAGYVSGTLRYEVLKRARFRRELCGVSADVRALEVDHIVPRVRGGKDNPDNLQALYCSCNSMRPDRDATDFRRSSRGKTRAGRDLTWGVNDGKVAGQTVHHCHLHPIPRRRGDVEDPTGGVRNLVPGKDAYR